MGNKKIMMLVFSVLLGAVAGFALLGYVRGVEDDVLNNVARVPVWVVTGPIAEGTTAASAQQTGRLELSEIESSFRPANAVSNLSEIEGQIAASDLVANQILLAGSFADPAVVATTFADQLAPGFTAFSLTIEKERAVNGFISPGDFVDVIVLGDPVIQAGETDVFETSLAASPYEQPARTLFRGVRIESIDDQLLNGPPPEEGAPPPEQEQASNMTITFSVPSSAAQRLLSVSPDDIVLTLLPAEWEPEQQENEVLEAIIVNEDLPGEDPTLITPYGADGFVDLLAENADDADETGDAATSEINTPDASTTPDEATAEDQETDEAADGEEGQ